jgi:hypothetical protein
MPAMTDTTKEMAAFLRKLKPAKLVVDVAGDSEPKTIELKGNTRQYSQAAQALSKLAWTQFECLDAEGNFLDAREAEEIEEEEKSRLEATGQILPDRDIQLLDILTRAQEMALEKYHKNLATIVDGHKDLIGLYRAYPTGRTDHQPGRWRYGATNRNHVNGSHDGGWNAWYGDTRTNDQSYVGRNASRPPNTGQRPNRNDNRNHQKQPRDCHKNHGSVHKSRYTGTDRGR